MPTIGRAAPARLHAQRDPQVLRAHRRLAARQHRRVSLLEHALREDLNATSKRALGVLRPLKVTLTNFHEAETIAELRRPVPTTKDPSSGAQRKLPLSARACYVEREDFMEAAGSRAGFRLSPGAEVRPSATLHHPLATSW
jgi:hypothetical protein